MTSSRLAAFLAPRSIALVGCPSDLSRPGARPLVYLKKHGYPGQIYPVNQRHSEIGGLRAYPTLSDLPDRPDTVCCSRARRRRSSGREMIFHAGAKRCGEVSGAAAPGVAGCLL